MKCYTEIMRKAKILLINIVVSFVLSVPTLFWIAFPLTIKFFVLPFVFCSIIPLVLFYSKKIDFRFTMVIVLSAYAATVGSIFVLFSLNPYLLAGF